MADDEVTHPEHAPGRSRTSVKLCDVTIQAGQRILLENTTLRFEAGKITKSCAVELAHVKPDRQVEILKLMESCDDYSVTFAKGMVLKTAASRRAKTNGAKTPWTQSKVNPQCSQPAMVGCGRRACASSDLSGRLVRASCEGIACKAKPQACKAKPQTFEPLNASFGRIEQIQQRMSKPSNSR